MSFQITMLSLIGAFYVLYIAKVFLLKKKGISVDVLGKGDKPKKALIVEIVLKAVTYIGAVVKVISVVFANQIWSPDMPVQIRSAGVILATAGVVFFALSITVMRDNWRAGFNSEQKTSLVTNGVYKLSRNPAFVGFDLLYIGCTLTFPSVAMISVAILAIIGFHIQILGEETFLAEKFGNEYLEYKGKVRRYI